MRIELFDNILERALRSRSITFAVLGIAMLAAACATTSPTLRKMEKEKYALVGTVPFGAPLVYQKGMDMVGAEVELARKIVETIGPDLQPLWVSRTFNTIVPALLNDEIDLIVTAFGVREDLRGQVLFSQPYHALEVVLAINPTHKDLRPNQLNGARIGVREGTAIMALVQEKFSGATAIGFNTVDDAALALRRGEVDGVIDDRLMLSYALDTVPGLAHLEVVPSVIETIECAVLVRPQDEVLLGHVNAAIDKVKSENLYSQWVNEHVGQHSARVEKRHKERLDRQRRVSEPRQLVIRVSKDANYDFDIYRMANLSFTLRNQESGESSTTSRIDFQGPVGVSRARAAPGNYTLSLPRFSFQTAIHIGPTDPAQVTIDIRLRSDGSVVVSKS